jgi:hypothetical protein
MKSTYYHIASPIPFALAVAFVGMSMACSSSNGGRAGTNAGETAPDGGPSSTEEAPDPDDPANQPPHALGTIVVGESHESESESVAPFVSATFVPDALAARACTKKLEGGCVAVLRPKCSSSDSSDGCADGELCAFDAHCSPTCQRVPSCSADCAEDEVCRLDKAGKAKCAKIETFDAGRLSFSGTTTPITLAPPYEPQYDGDGAPFAAGAGIKVQAKGASDAGFAPFEETFTATSFIKTTTSLNKLSRADVFGTGPLAMAWIPGNDEIVVSVASDGGSVTCKAKDADGSFNLPRSAILAAMGDTSSGTPDLTISVGRQRRVTKKGLTTQGKLASVTVQPEGWLDLMTMSTETVTVEGCSEGLSVCGDACADLKTDAAHCGTCGQSCGADAACSAGVCVDQCTACGESTKTGKCASEWTACAADPACVKAAECEAKCTTAQCRNSCFFDSGEPNVHALDFFQCALDQCKSACQ